jgi:hypothetical protein
MADQTVQMWGYGILACPPFPRTWRIIYPDVVGRLIAAAERCALPATP